MEKREVLKLAKKIWDYHHMNHQLKKADCILVLGSGDLRVAEYAAKLFLQGWAPLVVCSGGFGDYAKKHWNLSEADKFGGVAKDSGVPENKILIENKSLNTGENISFSIKLLAQRDLRPHSFILVHKPYMERRSFATFKKLCPEKECIVTSPPLTFEQYPSEYMSEKHLLDKLAADLQRIKIYPEKGFQIPQEIPADVWNAYNKLVAEGYDKHLVK